MRRIDVQSPDPDSPTEAVTGPGPSLALVIGAACVLVGVIFVAIAFVRSSDGAPSDASEVAPTVPVEAPGLEAGTTAPLGSGGLGEGVGPVRAGRTPLNGFGEVVVTVTTEDGKICDLCLLSAIDQDQHARGLMEVTDEDLGGYDGMLFEYPEDQGGAFWMRNTPLPLSIGYFDAAGKLISTSDMEPCGDEASCPSYPSDAPFKYAIEVPQGMLDEAGMVGDATLHIHARHCPLA